MEENKSNLSSWKIFLFGLVVGLILTFFTWLILNFHQAKPELPLSLSKKLNLMVSLPKPSLATNQKTFSIIGNTEIKSIVTITTSSENKIITTSSGGSFSSQINLTEGNNLVKISAFDPETGSSQTLSSEVFYLNEDLSSL